MLLLVYRPGKKVDVQIRVGQSIRYSYDSVEIQAGNRDSVDKSENRSLSTFIDSARLSISLHNFSLAVPG